MTDETEPLPTFPGAEPPPEADPFEVWTIYDRPDDYPDDFVVRVHLVHPKGRLTSELEPRAVVKALDAARAAIPTGKVRIVRDATDPYAVVESWV